MARNLIDFAETLAVDGINATRVFHPEKLDNLGKPRREYDLFFAVAGAERCTSGDQYVDGKRVFNAIQVSVSHSGYRKAITATATACFLHQHGHTVVIGLRDATPEVILAAPIPAARYGRKALDRQAEHVLDGLRVEGMPRTSAALADLWDRIVESHGVTRPALIPAGA